MRSAKNILTGLCVFLSIIVCSLILLKPLTVVASSDTSEISAASADSAEQEVVTINEEDVPLTGGIPQASINLWWSFAVIGVGMGSAALLCKFRAKKLINDSSFEQTIY